MARSMVFPSAENVESHDLDLLKMETEREPSENSRKMETEGELEKNGDRARTSEKFLLSSRTSENFLTEGELEKNGDRARTREKWRPNENDRELFFIVSSRQNFAPESHIQGPRSCASF